MSGIGSAVGIWTFCRMDQDDSRAPKVGRVGEKSSPMDLGSTVLGSFPCVRLVFEFLIRLKPAIDHDGMWVGVGKQPRLLTWLGSGSCPFACSTAGSFPFVLGLDLTILAGLGLLDSLSGSS